MNVCLTDKSKFEINLLKQIPRKFARLVDGEIHPFAAFGVWE
jgi:hypothetical protein